MTNLLADQTKGIHRINDGQHGVHCLVLLAAVHDERGQRDAMVGEVGGPLFGVELADVGIRDEQDTFPWLVYLHKVIVIRIEDVVNELKTCEENASYE